MDDDSRYDDTRYDDSRYGDALDDGSPYGEPVDGGTRFGDLSDTGVIADGHPHGDAADGAPDEDLGGGVPDGDEREGTGHALALPGFEVHHLLGAGATGQVWLAREARSGDLVALKRLHDPGDAAGRERLLREAVLLAGFTHDHLIRLRSVQADGDGAPVLVLDHAAGGSLAALLARRGRLEPGEVVTVAAPLAQALAAAHAAGLVHADVTPANVLFDATGRPLLADLGVSRLVGERRAVVESTADYLDPVVAGGGEPTPATDVHALAAVCHHLLTGAPPYTGPSLVQVLRAAAAGQRTPLHALAPAVPPALLEVVEEGLASDPAARPTADVFAARLLAAVPALPVRLRAGGPPSVPVAGTPLVGSPVPEAGRASPWRRRGRASRVAGLGARRAPDRPAVTAGTSPPDLVEVPAAVAAWSAAPAVAGGAHPAVRAPRPGSEPPGAHDLGVAWSSGTASPRPTHAVPVRRVEPVSPGEPLADLPGWRERCREALRGRRAVVATSGLALALVVGGSVLVGGAAADGRDVAGPLAVAAPAADPVAGPRTPTPTSTGDRPAGGEASDAPGATGSTGSTGALDEQGEPQRVDSIPDESTATPGRSSEAARDAAHVDDWHAVVEGLDALRASAFSTADAQVLDRVHAPGSAALAADRDSVAVLAAAGLTVDGARHEIRDVTVLAEEPGRVRVRVLDRLAEHRVLDRDGRLVELRPATTPAPVELELVDSAHGWRIASVTR